MTKTLYTEETPTGDWRNELEEILWYHPKVYKLVQQQINKAEERGQEKMRDKFIKLWMETKKWKREVMKGSSIKKDDILFWYELWIWDLQDSISNIPTND